MIDRNEWRAWLEKNHDSKTGVWLLFYKKDTAKPNISYEDSVEEALCFGWIDSIIRKIDETTYARKFTPRKPNSKWSKSNKERAERMIRVGKMTEHGIPHVEEAKKTGAWSSPVSPPKGLTVPRFMEEALEANEKALENFKKLGKSFRSQYIGWVTSAKKEETRRRRLAEAIELLEKNKKLGLK